ncbi:hypothetical protein A9Q99_20050 [Gammaproteobacteria bacterium 45_16_T64]|mgnify:CR=1 FL=1|nr:hypothetical protein A9Q99_20050 [Gammaproteobacteria bacterium 45_16_T64]
MQNQQNKRKYERLGTELDAVFSINGGAAHTCCLRDFSRGGLYLVYTDQSQYFSIRSHGLRMKDPIRIIISVDGEDTEITAKIAHYSEAGIGARFDFNHHVNYQALEGATMALQGNQAQARDNVVGKMSSEVSVAAQKRILEKCNQSFCGFLDESLNDYLIVLDELLLKTADRQKNDGDQHPFFDAIALFNRKRKEIVSSCVENISLSASEMSIGKVMPVASGSTIDLQVNQLSLVDKDDFEDWLIVRVLISRAELQFKEQLLELQLRLESVYPSPADSPLENPYSPSVLCKAFHKSVHGFKFNQAIEKVVFNAFQESLIDHLGKAYKQLNKIMIDENVLPDVDVNHYLATLASKSRGDSGSSTQVNKVESLDGGVNSQQSSESSEHVGDNGGGSYSDFQEGMRAARNAYSTALNLRRLHSNIGQSMAGERAGQGEGRTQPIGDAEQSLGQQELGVQGGAAQPQEIIQSNELMQVVNEVQGMLQGNSGVEYAGDGALIQHIERQIEGQKGTGVGIAPVEREKIDMIDSLFQSIMTNRSLASDLQPQFRKLEVPMLKVLMTDSDVLSEKNHPARQVVNSIAVLSDKDSLNVNKNKAKIEEVVDSILQHEGDGNEVYTQALGELAPMVEKEQFIAKRNVARVTEALDGQQRMLNATRAVENIIDKRLVKKTIPLIFVNLLDAGWRELMRLCYIREGVESKAWITSITVVEQLLLRLGRDCYDEERISFTAAELFKLVDKGISKIPTGKYNQRELLDELELILNSGEVDPASYVEFKRSDKGDTVSVLQRMVDLGASGTRNQLIRWIKRAKQLKQGQWIELEASLDTPRLCQLAWVSDDASRFVFVNAHGVKTADLALESVALSLKEREIKILSDERLPAVEQGLDTLVQKIYEQLSFETAHDQLTGLATRKEFERCLAQSVARAKKSMRAYMLCYLDLKQFKVINNTCGYEGGDSLLRMISQEMLAASGKDDIVGRLGSNEFALLSPVPDENEAFQVATKVKERVESLKFVWGGQHYTVSLSCSMVVFDHTGDHVLELLRGVESAASFAKENGYTEVQIYHPGDQRLEERDSIMSWVARINNALDNDQLKLRCQKISPIDDCGGLRKPHFEVLLTVLDEKGEHLPPADFIKAAEEYSRMAAVDRWIITKVLTWMSDNSEYVETIGGFAINLSGHSLNDDSFLDFIFEKLVEFDVPRNKLVFEVTETTAVANLDDAADFIAEMKEIGCRFSLDDFGAGQSSYAYLKMLPVDFIKIDGAFVKGIANDDVDYAMVKSITDMGHFLEKLIVAEYVTDQDVLDTVADIGVDYIQGFHLGKPCFIEELVAG